MSLLVGYDFFLFLVLFVLFVYVFATVTITNLHKVYLLFHFLMMLWPLGQFAAGVPRVVHLQLFCVPAVMAVAGEIVNPFYLFIKPLEGGYIHREYGLWFWVVIVILLGYFSVSLTFLFWTLYGSTTLFTSKKQVKITLWGIFVLTAFALSDLIVNVVLKALLSEADKALYRAKTNGRNRVEFVE